MRIAVISDIHGNLGALRAVLAEIVMRSADLAVNLGDMLSGPLFPSECADLLIPLRIATIRGNHEGQLLTLSSERMGESDRFTLSQLRSDHIAWVEQLPATMRILGKIRLYASQSREVRLGTTALFRFSALRESVGDI